MLAAKGRRAAAVTTLTALLAFTGAGCGDDGGGGSTELVEIEVTFDGGTVTPNGDRVDVDAGQPIDLVVTADEPGEIHVHSDPEQTFEYDGDGATTTLELAIDRPGVVEVESHDLNQVIVQLEVK
ncbi:MAG: hypothetical protein WB767_11650 [Nocardioides sp.]